MCVYYSLHPISDLNLSLDFGFPLISGCVWKGTVPVIWCSAQIDGVTHLE